MKNEFTYAPGGHSPPQGAPCCQALPPRARARDHPIPRAVVLLRTIKMTLFGAERYESQRSEAKKADIQDLTAPKAAKQPFLCRISTALNPTLRSSSTWNSSGRGVSSFSI